jgi:hypothetical protein
MLLGEAKKAYNRAYYRKNKEEIDRKAKVYGKSYRRNNRKKVNAITRAYVRSNKEKVFSYYGHKCQWPDGCDVTDSDMLQIDHIQSDGAIDRQRGLIGGKLYRYLIKYNFPKGYRLLCANHNWKHRANQYREGLEKCNSQSN